MKISDAPFSCRRTPLICQPVSFYIKNMNPLSFLRELRKLNYIRGLTKQREYGDVKKEDNDKLAVNYDVHLGFRFSPDLEPCKS